MQAFAFAHKDERGGAAVLRAPSYDLPKFDSVSDHAFSSAMVLRRKASCACGGGCDSCRSQPNTLRISQPDDPAEIEADRIAERVMRMPAGESAQSKQAMTPPTAPRQIHAEVYRKCDACEEEETEEPIQRQGEKFAASASDDPPPDDVNRSVRNIANSGGSPLDLETRSFFEPRLGMDLGHVRVHADAAAGRSARAINARAYTLGSNIVFGSDEYRPFDERGKHLLAHELVHVAQAHSGSASLDRSVIYRQPNDVSGEAETEAPLTRAEEIALSRTSPGLIAGETDPLTLSLYNFGIDVAQPKAEHRAVLSELGRFLGTRATVRVTVRSIGFADSSGPDRYNLRLSRRRADAVKAILDPLITQRISVAAYGETNPAAPNDTVEGRSRNRRVDLRFATDRPPGPLPPRPRPVPPGETPTPIPEPPQPQPPVPEPPGGGGGGEDTSFCEEHPILCGAGLLPFLVPLICLVAPEICVAVGCAIAPELCIPPIPPTPPTPPEPPEEPPDDTGQPRVIFVPRVRSSNTPAGMNDRIGLRDPVSVTATVINPPTDGSTILIFVSDNDTGAGNATINGQDEIDIVATTPLSVLGTVMTDGSYFFSPYIQLGAWWSGRLVGESNRFAVSSIMEDWNVVDAGSNVGPFGYVSLADMHWVSDSTALGDLDECRYVERVALIAETGGMSGMGVGEVNDPDDVNTGEFGVAFDEHGTPFQYTRDARRPGTSRLKQLFTIRDMRSNSAWAASRNSGFEIHRTYERDPANGRCWHFVIRKFGSSVTIGGWTTGAGSGDYTHEFRNIDCDPPPPPPPQPEPEPVPQPEPQPEPEPGPQPSQPPPVCCDRPEMARRVDICIENARQDAIECTAATLEPPYDPISNVRKLAEYWVCLEELRQNLLECDRKAKQDTNCPDVNTPPDCPPGSRPDDEDGGPRVAESRVQDFLESLPEPQTTDGDDIRGLA